MMLGNAEAISHMAYAVFQTRDLHSCPSIFLRDPLCEEHPSNEIEIGSKGSSDLHRFEFPPVKSYSPDTNWSARVRLGWVSEKWRIFAFPKFGKFGQHESHIRTIKFKLVIKNFPHPIKYIFSNIQTKFAKLEIYI